MTVLDIVMWPPFSQQFKQPSSVHHASRRTVDRTERRSVRPDTYRDLAGAGAILEAGWDPGQVDIMREPADYNRSRVLRRGGRAPLAASFSAL